MVVVGVKCRWTQSPTEKQITHIANLRYKNRSIESVHITIVWRGYDDIPYRCLPRLEVQSGSVQREKLIGEEGLDGRRSRSNRIKISSKCHQHYSVLEAVEVNADMCGGRCSTAKADRVK